MAAPPQPASRPSGRAADALRPTYFDLTISKWAEGACLISTGDTRVLVTASVEEGVPPFMKGQGRGWVTAEYGMLPRATDTRGAREAAKGKQSGRTQEIQRLIGRALRAAVDLRLLGERQIKIDCDVIQADGGTRTAAIVGASVAVRQALDHLLALEIIGFDPMPEPVVAVSCGLYEGVPILDLDYAEDSHAGADANFVMTASGGLIEVQGTAEDRPFPKADLLAMLALAEQGCQELAARARAALTAHQQASTKAAT